MIRMLFAMFVSVAGFAAAALWMARGGDAREVVQQILPEEVRSAVRSQVRETVARFDLEDVAPAPSDPAPEADAPAEAIAEAGAEEAAEPQPMVAAEETVEERLLSPRAEFARDLGAEADGAPRGEDGREMQTAASASGPSWGEDAAAPRAPDQDEWASLIRRMLAVYHRTRAVE